MPRRVLAGDFGGTRARVALFELPEAPAPPPAVAVPALLAEASYLARDLGGVGAALARFLGEQGSPTIAAACLGVAGAVDDNRVWLTNLGWTVDGTLVAEQLGVRCELINDLVATALGMAALTPADLLDLNPGAAEPDGNAVLIGAGTGLGMASLLWVGERVMVVSSEAGHCELPARSEEEWALRRFLADRLGGRVSVERVVSGMGLRNLYDFLVAEGTLRPAPAVVERLRAPGVDPASVIAPAGLDGSCALCARVLDLFASAFGAFAGDMALACGARGGVYLGGGVSHHLRDKLADGTFQRALVDKGRMSSYVERVPVRLLLRPDTAIWGAARRAAELAG